MTGAGGFVGREVVKFLREGGLEVLPCDLKGTEQRLDVLDSAEMMRVALEFKPHTFIHAAALTTGSDLKIIEVNVQGTLNALEAARVAKVQQFILFSSCGVYAPQGEPIPEEGFPTTAHAYGLSKLLAEQAVRLGKGSMTVWLLRVGAVYGAGENPSDTRARTSLIHQIAEAVKAGQRINVGRAPGDMYNWLHSKDLARLLQIITAQPSDGGTGLYNVAGRGVSVKELVQAFQKLKPDIDFDRLVEYTSNPPPRHGAIDNSKAIRELGFTQTVSLEEGLLDYLTPSPLVGEGWGEGVQIR
jgi:UDP-glucose 4-epimerase